MNLNGGRILRLMKVCRELQPALQDSFDDELKKTFSKITFAELEAVYQELDYESAQTEASKADISAHYVLFDKLNELAPQKVKKSPYLLENYLSKKPVFKEIEQQIVVQYYNNDIYSDRDRERKVKKLLLEKDVNELEKLYQILPEDKIEDDNIFSPRSHLADDVVGLDDQLPENYTWAIQKAFLKGSDMMGRGLFVEAADIVYDIAQVGRLDYLSENLTKELKSFVDKIYHDFTPENEIDYLSAINSNENFHQACPHLEGWVEAFASEGNTELADAYSTVLLLAKAKSNEWLGSNSNQPELKLSEPKPELKQ